MEGVGSTRLGRSSARYGPTTVFNGTVRRWKKKWVHVSPPSTAKNHNSKSHAHNGNSKIVLCRWIPLSSPDSVPGAAAAEDPPKRKFRYTPVAVLEEERNRAFSKPLADNSKTDEANQPSDWLPSKSSRANIDEDLKDETQDSNLGHLELGLGFKG